MNVERAAERRYARGMRCFRHAKSRYKYIFPISIKVIIIPFIKIQS